MDFDDQLRRYFGTTDLEGVTPAVLSSGIKRMKVDFGPEQDKGRRFALWAVMYMLGAAPDLDIAFKDDNDRNVARDFMDLLGKVDQVHAH